MRLPQSILRYFSAQTVNFLTIGTAIVLLGMSPVRAAASPQLACMPASLDFGGVALGQSETLLVNLTNNGQTSVTVSAISAGNAEFTTSGLTLPLVLSAGQSVDVSVNFTPTTRGWTYGTISFSSDASNATLVLAVSGAGGNGALATANPSIVSFGQVTMGSSSTVPVVLTNSRSSSTTISRLGTTGSGFSMSGPNLPLTLEAGQSVTVKVTFSPQTAVTQGGSLFAWGAGLVVPLTGTGTATAATYSVNLSWNSSSGAMGYNVYRSTTATGTYSRLNSTPNANTAYTDSAVAPGQTYYYSATSVNSSGVESSLATPPVQAVIP
jgi:Abnormal spindle-like microcephaly-assoc'd, ASPM-SPD-2-Hydin